MEKVILKSMVDFLLEQRMSTEKVNESSFYQIQSHIYSYYDKIFAYANFLKQPLNLGMFVPCDLQGNVLEIIPFHEHKKGSIFEFMQHKLFEEAKERVLFEGFEFLHPSFLKSTNCYIICELQNNELKFKLLKDLSTTETTIKDLYTIEDISKFNLELTPTAQKQIGL